MDRFILITFHINKMKKNFFLLILIFISFNTSSQQKVDIKKPMFGEVEKDERFVKLDDDFRKTTLEKFGNLDSAVVDYINKAWGYLYQNELETAMIRFNQAWLLNNEFPDVYYGFAALLDLLGNNVEANRFYSIGIEKDTDNQRAAICFQRIAECKENLNDIKGAVLAYSKICQLKPEEAYFFKKTGYLEMKLGNNFSAMNAYNMAIQLDPDDPATYYNRANLHQSMENYTRAIYDYTRCIKIDPTYFSAYVNRGILEMKRGNISAGKQDFLTSTRLDDKSAEAWRLLGVAKLSLNDKEGACQDFKKAKELLDTVVDELINQYCK